MLNELNVFTANHAIGWLVWLLLIGFMLFLLVWAEQARIHGVWTRFEEMTTVPGTLGIILMGIGIGTWYGGLPSLLIAVILFGLFVAARRLSRLL